ncbi:MAG: hypothetical protein CVU65_00220 [Deltaproteobacteria bacterium HGW-Deltaproteobacteria-22]|jgi:hypothetical protein|nr:MAG: hypothetical protein CVU65_00220 [Deltaproteobacteria bacterium HGW-Deltaproteobacteria-22]
MTNDVLGPHLELLREEVVLVQAWKKTASYIRYHNWFSDTLELDRTAINLPRFLGELAERLAAPERWCSDPLRIVPAPKSQHWQVNSISKRWEPVPVRRTPQDTKRPGTTLRPLAHASLSDQVAATAVMMCIADRVETLQGDPRGQITDTVVRNQVISYGNRLFCDNAGGSLLHRWGSGKLYRAHYQDYRSFLARPETVAEEVSRDAGNRIIIVHSDLRQFYDRVRPDLLARKLSALARPNDDPNFYILANRLLNWEWASKDDREIADYTRQAGIDDFSRVALPQGLVASGFFANVVLLDFDQGLRETVSQEIEPGVVVKDVCRYVDDLRIVLGVTEKKTLPDIEQLSTKWLQELLDEQAHGLQVSAEKTRAANFGGDERPLVRQSRKMARIQGAISGGFDAIGGEDILNAVQGLIQSQQRYSAQRIDGQSWAFAPVTDVLDATVERFAAARFRSTYRSLRPLLADRVEPDTSVEVYANEDAASRAGVARTQSELDDEARSFALGLIESWVEDPSNVRLLRIGLDLWPAEVVLQSVLDLLRPFTVKGGHRGAPRRVAWYCLSEVLRAGATETGFVETGEPMPKGIDIDAYRKLLRQEAVRLAELPPAALPWYLRQQAFLYLAANDPKDAPVQRGGTNPETKHYRELIRFLRNEGDRIKGGDFSTLAVLARRSFCGRETAIELVRDGVTSSRLEQIGERDPSFALEILESRPDLAASVTPRLRDDLCLRLRAGAESGMSLAEIVLQGTPNGSLRNELAVLRFASKFLKALPEAAMDDVITPEDVRIRVQDSAKGLSEKDTVSVASSRVTPAGSMYRPPRWCPADKRWRFQLGYLLRFILTARQDFTKIVRPPSWKETATTYRAAESHWYQRLYGLFNGHSAFGDDWLPISDWIEQLLFSLLRWPGCQISEMDRQTEGGVLALLALIEERQSKLDRMQGGSSGVLLLPFNTSRPDGKKKTRPLRACVVQTVTPTSSDIITAAAVDDLSLSERGIRKTHRNHLSAALAAIERMLDLRETHMGLDGRLDWLILPELAVHPLDVKTHLIPFARKHRAIILAGLTYQELFAGQPLVNSAIWIMPTWSAAHGLQTLIRRQGKHHLAAGETKLNNPKVVVQGWRPCQWLVGYDWSSMLADPPLWLTAAVCYDATDLALAADLRHHSDVFAIPALNRDVGTFDQMALALHYHMFQYVVIANNGEYGGSNAYHPWGKEYQRQMFHLHGQPQASVAFFEINNIDHVIARRIKALAPESPWKSPPAGLG